ncbi:hydroxysqualene dehydroxylase HpnE [Rhizomicrobium electricum]|uniref:Hydroxysqualene dehydroxylase HpnE n=1 Tax=Rhizomicrobium electricum TaxID=480070 RepID=A0ABN1FAN6_9PROT|nr:hydroxysqualene dehydroxylase HpnE [Rhizomicrobium electricum]NIJ50559.1 squalene-associated FAD-dependent desaturase [Rhizomicrobium electricum]
MRTIVVGAGLSGLAAAVTRAVAGDDVVVYEAAGHAGGRCRSYVDATLDCVIDNGNHLVLSGNPAVQSFLKTIGSPDALTGPETAEFDFVDLQSGERWTLKPNEGPLPWWIFARDRRVPGTTPLDYLKLGGLLAAGPAATVADLVPTDGPLWTKMMGPVLLAVLNTDPKQGSAKLTAAVLKETMAKGGRAYRPRIAHPNLGAAFIEPALRKLTELHALVHFGQRLRRIVFGEGKVIALEFPENTVPVGPTDRVVLAVPPWVAQDLIPGLSAPTEFRAIVNAHFKVVPPADAPKMLGVVGGTAEWIFAFEDRVSVTVSGADWLADRDREDLARTLWDDVARALNLPPVFPVWQIVKEKRATFAATPEQDALRPPAKTQWQNLRLAGDWTQTGLPATIEGALRSGVTAAAL